MAKSYMLKGPGHRHTKVIVSDQDAHWLNVYVYTVNAGRGKMIVAKRRDSAKSLAVTLQSDIYGKGTRVLHVNGDPMDFRRSNCTLITRQDHGRLMILDEMFGCSVSPRRQPKEMSE
jgi:hypothetical protein